MTEFERDRHRGRLAALAREPYDPEESPGWLIGYGDAVTIEPVPEPDSTAGPGSAISAP